ncbi:hypothetical protein ACQKDD_17835 [Planococcus kocurii]|uniref:hypothetical protein n=1 Tax=Planococcus TaxID=1372 RepID=UPI0011EE288D|nr:hypothetical protein [Planococcus sp. ANT_H30]KAA0957599.1 hypothetical protein FQ085_05950 [Planococcus sp. ANT_H30]
MRKITCLVVTMLCIALFFSTASASADNFYHKGSAYSTQVTDELNREFSSASSVVVISSSTYYSGVNIGKEHVRVFSRCQVVKNITGATTCYVRDMSVRLSASYSTGTDRAIPHFIQQMTPAATVGTQYFTSLRFLIRNYAVIAVGTIVEAAVNGSSFNVDHSTTAHLTAGRVIFKNPPTSQVDVPTSVAYNKIDYYYDGVDKGLDGYFTFSYDVPSGGGIITSRGDATYNLSIPSGNPYQPNLVIDVKTDEAILPHSIGA